MNKYSISFVVIVTLLSAGVIGCANQDHRKVVTSPYQTTTPTPIQDLEKAVQANLQGIAFLEKRELDQAQRLFQASLTHDVTYGPAHNNLGKVYFFQEKYYQAAWEFQYAIKLMPNHPEPKNNLGLVLETVGKLDEAIGVYAQAVELETDNPEWIGNLARAHIKRGDNDARTRTLLEELLLKDTRSHWRSWAQEHLVLLGQDAKTSKQSSSEEIPGGDFRGPDFRGRDFRGPGEIPGGNSGGDSGGD